MQGEGGGRHAHPPTIKLDKEEVHNEEKRLVVRSQHRKEGVLLMVKIGCKVVDWIEHGNEPMGSMKGGEFLD
jgi:hypothetical protein